MNVGVCKFCNRTRDLVRAHIIPRALYPPDANGSRMQVVLDGKGELPPFKLPNGDYDPNLVCRECEDFFNPGDNYAKQLLVDRRADGRRKFEGHGAYWEYSDVEYGKLKLFFISLLWRAHATLLRSFDRVNLGPTYELATKTMLQQCDPGRPDDFGVFILRMADSPLDKLGASPTPRRLPPNNVRVYEFLLFGYIAYVKVDQQPYGYPFKAVQLTPGSPLRMLEKSIEDTPFLRFAQQANLMAEATKDRLRNTRATKFSTAFPQKQSD